MTTPTEVFVAERPRLVGLAYRMLGSRSDAEDAVQDAWLRWQAVAGQEESPEREPTGDGDGADGGEITTVVANPAAYLTTMVTRLSLDRLRAAHRERDSYVGPWLAEPIMTPFDLSGAAATDADPAGTVALADTLTLGFLALLDLLEPVERAPFLLREVFDEPYSSVAAAIGRKEAACRQVVHRARERIRAARTGDRWPGRPASSERELELFGRFCTALATGDLEMLRGVLLDDVVLTTDGGPSRHAARRPVRGADRVGRLLMSVAHRLPVDLENAAVRVNGQPGMVCHRAGVVDLVWSLEMVDEGIVAFRSVLNPEKLAGIRLPGPPPDGGT